MQKIKRFAFGFGLLGLLSLGAWTTTRIPTGKILYDVPLVRQSTHFSCGAAALLSVLTYYGVDDYNESELMKEVESTPEHGTFIEKMRDLALKHGIKAEIKSRLTLDDLKQRLKKNQPVIVDAQAWHDSRDPKNDHSYKEEWADGHYMVVIGIDKKNVYFMDPSMLGSRGYIPVDEFMDRWHELNSKNEKEYQTAILFDGKPSPPPPWEYVP